MTTTLRLDDVNAYYNYYKTIQVLNHVSLEVASGSITALLGANGAGKTTTFKAICGVIWVEGKIFFEDQRIDQLSTEEIARLRVAHVSEKRGIFVDLTVEENLRLGAVVRNDKKGIRADMEKMYEYFPVLAKRRRHSAGKMSLGEQQMLAIARGLMLKPRLMLLDEPSIGLATSTSSEIFERLKLINAEEKLSVLVIEQNAALAFDYSDFVYVMETGRVVAFGPSSVLKNDAALRRMYLG